MKRQYVLNLTSVVVLASTPAMRTQAQQVLLVGNVKLADRPDASEVVFQGRFLKSLSKEHSPVGGIFVYVLPGSQSHVSLTFGMIGYDFQTLDSLTPVREYSSLVAPEIVLTRKKSIPDDGTKDDDGNGQLAADEFRTHLEKQAAIAEKAGPAFVDILQWNLAEYEVAVRDNARLKETLEAFSADTKYKRIASPISNPNIGKYRRVIEARAGIKSKFSAREALGLATDRRASGPVRAAAVDALLKMNLNADDQSNLLVVLRQTADTTRSASLLTSSYIGLTKLGNLQDRQKVLNATKSRSPSRVSAAISAISVTKVVDPDSVVGDVIRTNPNPAVRAAVIDQVAERDLDAKPSPAQTKAITEVLTKDTSTAVRLRAVEALGRVSAADTAVTSRQARQALQAVAVDSVRPDLKRAATRAVRRPDE